MKDNRVYKSIVVTALVLIVLGVVFLGYLALVMQKEQREIFEIQAEQREIFEIQAEQAELIMQRNIEFETRTLEKINKTNNTIITLNEIYESILREQKKRRVESVYVDKVFADRQAEAARLLREGKVNQAHSIYEFIAREQPENKEARFYMYYTLFSRNRSDKEEYSKIKRGFSVLEKEGYMRKEMLEILEYIEKEKNFKKNR